MKKPLANDPPVPQSDWDDDAGPWRHPPVAPKDEGIAESFGKSISDVITGPLDHGKAKPKPIPRS